MPIASALYFTKEHICANKKEAPDVLAEQAAHCLELVAELVREGLDFTFKGGNSLLVLLEEPRRFSIDVDIATDETRERIDQTVEGVVKKHGLFTRFQKRQHKTKPWLPMVSYEIFYASHFTDNKENFIMLDAILKKNTTPKIRKKVACGGLYQCNETVELPTISRIIGDKLLTLGPRTLGIPLGKNKEAQRLKHGHDVALLAEQPLDLDEIRQSVAACMKQELEIQEKTMTEEEVLADTLSFCVQPFRYAEKPVDQGLNPALSEIVRGHVPFAEHLFSRDYSWQRLQKDLARAALCLTAAVVKTVTNSQFKQALAYNDAAAYWKQTVLWWEKDPE